MSRPDDTAAAAAQIGSPVRGRIDVAHRCHLSLPVVLEVPPVLPSGEPFPTRYWLSCPLLHRRVARLEADGGVKAMEARVRDEPAFADALEHAHARYARERDARVPSDVPHRPRGGVAGSRGGVKCLHAHLADRLAGHDNPVGAWVAERVLPTDCERPCVVAADGGAVRDPGWVEPSDA